MTRHKRMLERWQCHKGRACKENVPGCLRRPGKWCCQFETTVCIRLQTVTFACHCERVCVCVCFSLSIVSLPTPLFNSISLDLGSRTSVKHNGRQIRLNKKGVGCCVVQDLKRKRTSHTKPQTQAACEKA